MNKLRFGKRTGLTVALVTLALLMCLSVVFATILQDVSPKASAATNVGSRVTPLELMSVHQVDWVMGPLDVNADGSYKAANKDYNGDPTNNVYKIPADKYFNVNNYLYTTTLGDRKILRGWKNNIQKVTGDSNIYINENGYIVNSGVASTNIGIYVDKDISPSLNKYMLIMPDDITEVGTGSGAFDGATSTSGSASGTASSNNSYDQFTDFAFYVWSGEAKYDNFSKAHTNYWAPRERLAGVYFNSTSQLKSVNNGANPAGGYRLNLSGKAAFAGCNNMKFFVLPDNNAFTTIGSYAFCNCEQLRDFTIPASVTTISSYALANCMSIVHLTVPQNATAGTNAFSGMTKLSEVQSYASGVTTASFPSSSLLNFYTGENGSKLYVVGNDENDTGANGYYFCKNVLGYNGDLATVAVGTAQKYKKDNWYVVGLSGKEDSTGNLVHRFPKQVVANDPRRSNVLFDYLDSAGHKCKNTIDEPITKYDIGKNMALETWCTAAVLPDCVEIVGDSAFEFSHIQYLELSATTVGTRAFYRNVESTITNEYYYIHKQITSYGNNAFAKNDSSSIIRHYIFENKALYNIYAGSETSLKTSALTKTATIGSGDSAVTPKLLNSRAYYQIPVIAIVQSADGDVNIIEGDIDTRFDYDTDYNTRKKATNVDANDNGTYEIIYTKRCNGLPFSAQKQALGNWDTVLSSDHSNPTIEGMTSTQWYTSATYETKTTAASSYTNTATSVNIYTKKVAKPTIVDKVGDKAYTFGDVNIPSENIDLLDLGVANPNYKTDYVATITAFTFASGNKPGATPTSVSNAGTYTVAISLNEEKWGKWTDEYQSSFTGTVVVNRKPIDLGDLANIPTFSAGGVALGGEGDGAALYHYDSGWYLYNQSGSQIGDTVYANNSYTRYTESEIHITPNEWTMYGITPSTGDHYGTGSRDYYATFSLTVKGIDGAIGETNFEFVYDSESANAELFALYGLVLDNKTTSSATLRKTWYIVMQSNWFIDSTAPFDENNPYSTPPYALALRNGSSVRTWTYEDVLDIRTPKLAYNQDYSGGSAVTVSPIFSVVYNGVSIVTDESDLTKLAYYVNPSMPAGTYTVIVSAPAIQAQDGGNYPAISNSIQIIVTPKALNTTDLQAALQNNGNAYEFPYDMSKHLYYKEGDEGFIADSGVDYELSMLNQTLNAKRAAAVDRYLDTQEADSYWATQAADGYFGQAQITYNLDRMGTSNYSSYELAALTSVDTYTVYYCISAKNYITVGGENDVNRRDKKFTTLIYNEILVSSLFGSQNDSSEYLQNMEYNGSDRYTSVPYNQLYRSEYTDADYINARTNVSVTITLLNSQTSRWKYDLTDDEQMARVPRPTEGSDVSVIVAYYDITPAFNSWAVSPQMPSWTFNGFDRDVNVVASGLRFVGADVMYRLGIYDEDGKTIVWTNYFIVNSNGEVISGIALDDEGNATAISQENIISELNLLKPGNYYLQSKVGDIKVGGAVNVLGGEFVADIATVNIAKANNRWTRSPNIVRWTWGEYNSARHVISSTSLYPSVLSAFFNANNIDIPVVEYQIWKYVDLGNGAYSLEAINGLSGEDFWFTAVSEEIAQILGGLDAGDYVLRARLNGTDYYTDIEDQDSIFDIARATNSWKYSPNVVRWDWSNYNKDINLITSTPVNQPNGAVVHYTILNGKYELADAALRNFTEVNAQIAEVLAKLPAGNYYLVASLEGTDNFLAINDWDTIAAQEKPEGYVFGSAYDFADTELNKQLAPIQFSIGKINNAWVITPGMTGWQYKEFVSGNFIFGEPKNTPTDKTVKYTVTKPDNTKLFDLEYVFNETTSAFELTGASVAALKALTVGNYQLNAALDGTTDYSPLDYSTTFSVIKANNTWKEYPGMTSWQYKGFAVSTNFTAGEPANVTYNGANKNVATYTVSGTVNGEDKTWTFNSESTDTYIESLLQALTVLDGSRYTMKVEYPGDSNYNKMEYGTTFEVILANNSWTTTPALAGWQYSYFAESNFREGVPALNDANKAISYVITKSGDANVNITLGFVTNAEGKRVLDSETVKALKALAVSNNYTLKVTLEGTTNYSGVTQEIGFSVSAASTNAWTAIPSISGWTYKQFDASLLTEGAAQFGTVTYTVYKGNDEVVVVVVDGSDVALENLSATDLVKYLALLNANDYVLFVEAAQWTDDVRVEPEDADYAYATRTLRFTVSRANDTWATYPSMAGWTYGNAVGALTEGKPTVKTGAVSYEYYKAKQENGEWVPTGDAIKELTSTTPAGDYVLVATVAQGTNYNELTHVVHFVVSKADNNWKTNCEPEDRLDWTWGDYSVINGSKLINAESTVNASVAYTIVKVLSENQINQIEYEGSTTFSQSNIVDVLKTLGSGDYRVTSTVAATDNYDVLTKITSVTVSKAKLTVTNPACSGWTWGTADTNKQFTDVTVSTVLTSDQSKVAIAYKLDGNGCADYDDMLSKLKGSNAGTHTVVITVTCENYDDEEKTLTVVIGNADFIWETNPTNTSWTWNGLETGDGKQVVEPKAKDLAGQYVVFTFTRTVGSNTTTYASFEELQKLLFKASVGAYTIDVACELTNYNSINKSFTVTVNKAANEWMSNAPQASYECEYTNKNSINILQATAKFGTVVYQDKDGNQLINGSTAITTEELLNAWIQGLSANDDTPYEFYTVVIGTDNYEGLRNKTEILVTGTKSNWSNKDDIKDSVNLTFSDSLNAELDTELNNAIPYGDNAKGVTSYTISYVGNNGKKVENIALTSVEAVMDWIKGINVPDNQKHASAGTYTIKSTFEPTDKSYTTLNHTLTVVVARAKPQWDKTLGANYYGQYGSIEVPTITVKGYSAPISVKLENLSNSGEVITVTVKDGQVTVINGNDVNASDRVTFAEYVKTLNAVTTYYAVSYSVEATDNYEGLNEAPDAKTSRLYISPIVNTWLANTEAGITAADWVNGYTWTFTRGDTVAVTLPQATTGNDSIKITREDGAELGYKTEAELNAYLATANLPAGTYKLVFTIPQSGNYNGLVSNCQIVINKNANEWKTELANYNGSGNVNSDNFTLPEAKEQNNLLRFNVVKADGSIIGTGLVLGTGADNETNTFRAILKTLANGTYTVTAYVGGTAGYNYDKLESTDSLKIALDKYNADYNILTSTCTINLTPHSNKWTATLSGQTWTYDAFDASLITEPKADWGNNTIEYTLRKGNTILQTFTVEKYGSSIFTAVTTELGKLNAGTYSLTAVIAGTDIYNAPETLTAVFVVSPVTTAWTLSDTELAQYEYITGVWNAFQGNELPVLAVANWTGAEIVYAVNGVVVTDNGLYSNPWIKELKTLGGAGTYIFTATVNADENGNHTELTFRARVTATAVQSSWTPTTATSNGQQYSWVFAAGADNETIPEPEVIANTVAEGSKPTYTLRTRSGSYLTFAEGSIDTDDWSAVLDKLAAQPSGEYIIAASVAGGDNYTALTYSVNVTVSLANNSWESHMNTANAENYTLTWTFGAADNTAIVYEAAHNNDDLEFTVDGGKVAKNENETSLQALQRTLANLGAGEHAIVASVKADTMYGALSETIKLVIKKASNSWTTNLGINGWTWNDGKYETPTFVAPVPAQGTTSSVTVRNASNAIVLEATLSYSVNEATKVKTVNVNDYDAFVRKLYALDVGTYSIIVSVGETDNYEALTSETKSFEITKATNDWTQSGKPTIAGWDFGGSTAYPSATPQFGQNTVRFSYSEVAENEKDDTVKAPIGDHTWKDAPSYTAGKYWLRAYVPGTDNYTELTGYHKFSVNEAKNAWVKTPGVVEWSWNGYDKDINLFRGSARSNQPARFTVTRQNGSDLAVSDFNAFGGKIVLGDGLEIDVKDSSINTIRKYLTEFTLDADGKVSDAVASILNALKNGTYKLTVEVDGGESLQAISGEAEFTVSKANNEWTTAPNVLSFDYNGYIASGDRASFTAGESKYGTVSYQITGTDNDGKNVSLNNLTIDQVGNGLKTLNAGNYILNAWVVAGNTYNAFYSVNAPYQVLFSVNRIENGWTEDHSPNTSISKTYTDLHADGFNFNGWFGTPQTIGNDAIAYTLLYTDYTSAKAGTYNYGELFKAIKELGSGEYIVHMAVAQSCNYLALTANTSLSIQRKANSFTAFPTNNLSGQWQQKDDEGKLVNDSTLDVFTVTADEGNDTITYTINSVKCASVAELAKEVAKLNAGSYQVVIAVEQTNYYAGLSRTVQLDIAPGKNVLDWSIVSTWNWHNGLTRDDGESYRFLAEKPLYGTQITVEITNKNDSNSSSTVTVNFADSNPLAVINQIISGSHSEGAIIGGLDAGTYTIKVTASASNNWAEISETATFTIDKANNAWTADPALDGTLNDGVYSYGYGAAINPSATATYGTVKYAYYVNNAEYQNGTAKPLSGKPVNVGNYVVEISVDKTTNYHGIAATALYFDIVKVLNDSFIVSPSAVGWTWGSYDRTVHMFTGIPRSGGNVSFSILDENKNVVSINNTALDKMLLVGLIENGEHHYNDVDKDMYLEKDFAALVAQLKEGNYYLQINVDATNNNTEFTAITPFRVTAAENGWKITPKIASWSLGLFNDKVNMPQAEPRFGTAYIVVTSQNNDEVYYDSKLGINRLENALAGWYMMKVTVEAETGCYNGLSENVPVQVYMRGSNETKNYWYESFGINPWEAIVGNIGNKPYGTPLRGLPYFEFYYAKRDANNQLVIDWDRPVEEGPDSFLLPKGDLEYYKDFYVPMAPGDYFMVACAVNVDSEGKVIEADNIREIDKPYPLHIDHRANTFTDDPHIDTLLFLGERDTWANPTATTSLAGSDIWFTYKNADTGEDLGKEKPSAEGKYIVIAHAIAKYSLEITKEAKFTVELSTNEWIDIPTMENWSEENEANIIEWSTKFDADEIVYTYENVETGEKFNSKPVTEGTYKVTATVKKEGYHDLVGTTTFTIEPAYDRDLLRVDIALGVVACALAIFVIIFAIRRYKEN